MWEIAENLHRVDLTKEERDKHIRRYAELLETKNLQSPQSAAFESKREDGRGHRKKGTAGQIADQTGLSKDTIDRALNPPDSTVPNEDADVRQFGGPREYGGVRDSGRI